MVLSGRRGGTCSWKITRFAEVIQISDLLHWGATLTCLRTAIEHAAESMAG